MAIEIPVISLDVVISIVLSFAIGMISVMAYSRLRDVVTNGKAIENAKGSKDGDTVANTTTAIIEAVVAEYSRRLKDYDRMIGDLRTKIDILEVRMPAAMVVQQPSPVAASPHQYLSQSPPVSHMTYPTSQQVTPHTYSVSEPVTVTYQSRVQQIQSAEPVDTHSNNNGTNDYILKLLVEKPRSSREIQHSIGRTREHTARLMKRLYQEGLVLRDTNSKPFKYSITDAGRAQLKHSDSSPNHGLSSNDSPAGSAVESLVAGER